MYADDPIHACLPFCESFLCSSFKICILIIALRGKGQQNWYMSLVYPLLVVHCIVHVYADYIPSNCKNRGKFFCVENICCVLRVNSCMQRLYWSQGKKCWYMYHWLVDPFLEAFLSGTNDVEQQQQQELLLDGNLLCITF